MTIAIIGLVLFVFGLLSRLFGLWLYRRVVATESREITPSRLTKGPWFTADSDAAMLRRIVFITYASLLVGMALLTLGVLLL